MISTILLIVFGAVLMLPFALFCILAFIEQVKEAFTNYYASPDGTTCCIIFIAAAIGGCLLWIGVDRLIGG